MNECNQFNLSFLYLFWFLQLCLILVALRFSLLGVRINFGLQTL